MKSTRRLIDNLMADEFRKAKVDLDKAVQNIMKSRVKQKKEQTISHMNNK